MTSLPTRLPRAALLEAGGVPLEKGEPLWIENVAITPHGAGADYCGAFRVYLSNGRTLEYPVKRSARIRWLKEMVRAFFETSDEERAG